MTSYRVHNLKKIDNTGEDMEDLISILDTTSGKSRELRSFVRTTALNRLEFVLKAFCQGDIDSLIKPIGLGELELALLGASGAKKYLYQISVNIG